MKRFIILFLAVVLLLCSLTGCDSKEYKFYQSTEEIAKIEVVKVPSEPDLNDLKIDREIRNNNFDSVEYLTELPAEMIEDFLTKLKSISCSSPMPPWWGFWGESFLITYNDGSWQLINSDSTNYYNKAEDKFYNPNLAFDIEGFDALWNKYAQLDQ